MERELSVDVNSQEAQETEFGKIIWRLSVIEELTSNRDVEFQEIRKKLIGGITSQQEAEDPKDNCTLAIIYHKLDRIDYSLKSMMETVKELNKII